MLLIDAEALIDEIKKAEKEFRRCKIEPVGYKMAFADGVGSTADLIVDEAPTVEERKRGHWFDPEDDDGRTAWHCSVCDYVVKTIGFYPNYNYCPCCGARMDKGVRK